uniref:ANK_REP_REGION domain-containing protein n=1 Tax=Macrostomum lignano TaxID=282301 RepID=A0A1I8JJ31_9PLAT
MSSEKPADQLEAAARNGNFDSVKKFLAVLADSAGQEQTLEKVIKISTKAGHAEMVSELLKYAPDSEFRDRYCRTAIQTANVYDREEIVKESLPAVTDADVLDQCRQSAVECFARNGRESAVMEILKAVRGSPVENECLRLATYGAASRGHKKLVSELIQAAADATRRNEVFWEGIRTAATFGHNEIVSELLQSFGHNAVQDQRFKEIVGQAVKNGHKVIADELIAAVSDGAIKDSLQKTALWEAAKTGRHEMLAGFLPVSDSTTRDKLCVSVVRLSVSSGHPATAYELAKTVRDAECKDQCCEIVIADGCKQSWRDTIADALELVSDSKRKERLYNYIVLTATRNGWRELLTRLLQTASHPNLRDRCCKEATLVAANEGHVEILSELLNSVSDPEMKNKCYRKGITGAAMSDQKEALALLLHTITDQQVKDRCCIKAVGVAARKGHESSLSQLLAAIANPDSKIQSYKDATICASADGRSELVTKLLQEITDPVVRAECCSAAVSRAALSSHVPTIVTLLAALDDSRAKLECLKEAVANAILDGRMHFFSDLLQTVPPELRHQYVQIGVRTSIENARSEALTVILRGLSDVQDPTLQGCKPPVSMSDPALLRLLNGDAVKRQAENLALLAKLHPEKGRHAALLKSIEAGHVSLAVSLLPYMARIDSSDAQGITALMLAARHGHDQIVHAVLAILADPAAVNAQDNEGFTALSMACRAGHVRVAKYLMDAGAELKPRDVQLASEGGHADFHAFLLWKLNGCPTETIPEIKFDLQQIRDDPNEDQTLSIALHKLLNSAGFTQQRVVFQTRMADFLQSLAKLLTKSEIVMTGSFADGWGNNLVKLNGRTAADSDIDWTVIVPGVTLHLQGGCACSGASIDRLSVDEGHVVLEVAAGSSPAIAADACGMRPAMDTCYAFQCCSEFCADRCSVLLSDHEKVHLVRATRPNSNSDLRVSFSFHEKKIIRQLNTIQGQLFILLKFVCKRLLPRLWRTQGLKTYNAKTLLFFIMERHRLTEHVWQPENLISLLKESLNLMLQFMTDSPDPDICMPHFFMPKAPLFVKNAGIGGNYLGTKRRIAEKLFELRKDANQLYQSISAHVRPLQSRKFYCHPFTLLPLTPCLSLAEVEKQKVDTIVYVHYGAQIYNLVFAAIVELQADGFDKNAFAKRVCLLPHNCCDTAKLCLMVMAELKVGNEAEAKKLSGWDATDSISWDEFFREFPKHNFAWRFCFAWEPNNPALKFDFLPHSTRHLIAVKSSGQSSHLYINFRCLWWSLVFETQPLLGALFVERWLKELREDFEDAEFMELETVYHICLKLELQKHAQEGLRLMEQLVRDQKAGLARGEAADEEKFESLKSLND